MLNRIAPRGGRLQGKAPLGCMGSFVPAFTAHCVSCATTIPGVLLWGVTFGGTALVQSVGVEVACQRGSRLLSTLSSGELGDGQTLGDLRSTRNLACLVYDGIALPVWRGPIGAQMEDNEPDEDKDDEDATST